MPLDGSPTAKPVRSVCGAQKQALYELPPLRVTSAIASGENLDETLLSPPSDMSRMTRALTFPGRGTPGETRQRRMLPARTKTCP